MTALRWGSATHAGMVRKVNQDALLAEEGVLFAVADGMGGHAAGEVASKVAVEALRDYFEPEGDIERAVRMANRAVWARADDEPELRGMGTTITALAVVPPGAAGRGEGEDDVDDGTDHVMLANVGDSRAYLFRDGELTQLTEDHSLVSDLVRENRLSAAEARNHPQRNILTRVLGNEPDVQVDRFEVVPYVGDRFVLCSDGLFNEVDEDRIAAVLRRLSDPDEAAKELVRLANEEGGRDNVTVVLVDVVDDGGRAEAASTALAEDPPTQTLARSGGAPPIVEQPPGAGAGDGAEEEAGRPSRKERRALRRRTPRPRRVTWRSVLFVVALLAVIGGAVGAVYWFSRATFYVGVDDGEVTIFRGRPGGVLWIEPTVEERTGLDLQDVPAARRADLEDGKQESTLTDAREYVANLREDADAGDRDGARSTTTISTSSTTTTTQ